MIAMRHTASHIPLDRDLLNVVTSRYVPHSIDGVVDDTQTSNGKPSGTVVGVVVLVVDVVVDSEVVGGDACTPSLHSVDAATEAIANMHAAEIDRDHLPRVRVRGRISLTAACLRRCNRSRVSSLATAPAK